MNTARREAQELKSTSLRMPRTIQFGQIVNLIACLAIFSISLTDVWGDYPPFVYFMGFLCILVIITFPRYFWRIEYNNDRLILYRFPLPVKEISWDEIDHVKMRKHAMGFSLVDRFGKSLLGITPIYVGLVEFFSLLRKKRPGLFSLPSDPIIKKKIWGNILLLISIWFLFAIIFVSLISISAGSVFAAIYVCISLCYIFWGVLEIRLTDHQMTVKTLFSENTFSVGEISSIELDKSFRQPYLNKIVICSKNGKQKNINFEGHNTLILFNQLSLWLENQQEQQANTP